MMLIVLVCASPIELDQVSRDDGNFTLQFSHDFSFRGVGTASASENLEMDPLASVVECASAHIGGAKSIRRDDDALPPLLVFAVRNRAALIDIGYNGRPYFCSIC
jgi:hypothetical protein